MRLCFVGPLGSVHLRRWVRFFAARGHDVAVITPAAAPEALPGVQVHIEPLVRTGAGALDTLLTGLTVLPAILRYRRRFRQIRPEVVHAHYLNEAALFAALAADVPLAATAWGSDVLVAPRRSLLRRGLVRRILRRADLITCDAGHVRRALLALGADPAKVHLVYFGTDVDIFSPERRDAARRHELAVDGAPAVISLRTLDPLYDVGTLIAAVPLVLAQQPEVRFIIAGTGPQAAQLQAQAQRLGVADRVRFVGAVDERTLPSLLASADIYVSTALSDGGLAASTAEAMACGLPVIVTDVADNREWVADGVSGVLIPPRDPAALAKAILRLAADVNVRRAMGRAGRKVIEERNNWKVEMARMDALYRQMIASDARR